MSAHFALPNAHITDPICGPTLRRCKKNPLCPPNLGLFTARVTGGHKLTASSGLSSSHRVPRRQRAPQPQAHQKHSPLSLELSDSRSPTYTDPGRTRQKTRRIRSPPRPPETQTFTRAPVPATKSIGTTHRAHLAALRARQYPADQYRTAGRQFADLPPPILPHRS